MLKFPLLYCNYVVKYKYKSKQSQATNRATVRGNIGHGILKITASAC